MKHIEGIDVEFPDSFAIHREDIVSYWLMDDRRGGGGGREGWRRGNRIGYRANLMICFVFDGVILRVIGWCPFVTEFENRSIGICSFVTI